MARITDQLGPLEQDTAVQRAKGAGLTVMLDEHPELQALVARTPHITSEHGPIRLFASRVLDIALVSSSPGGIELVAEQQTTRDGEVFWRSLDQIDTDIVALMKTWVPHLLEFLFPEDEAALAEERSHLSTWTRMGPFAFAAFRRRQHARVFGTYQTGDIGILRLPRNAGNGRVTHVLQETDPDAQENAISIDSPGRRHFQVSTDAIAMNPLIKLSPATAPFIPKGHLSAHRVMALLSHQARIDARRANGPLTKADIEDLVWKG